MPTRRAKSTDLATTRTTEYKSNSAITLEMGLWMKKIARPIQDENADKAPGSGRRGFRRYPSTTQANKQVDVDLNSALLTWTMLGVR